VPRVRPSAATGRSGGWTCGGRASTPPTAATCRSSPPPTAGRSGPRPCGPGREHDTTALRAHPEALPLLAEWTDAEHAALADLGYEGERAALTTPIKKTSDAPLTDDQRTVNLLHAATRAPAERGNSLLKTTFKALRRVSLCPWRIGAITAAALVLLHHQHDRTT
jgi:DDE superfamily endonuclease